MVVPFSIPSFRRFPIERAVDFGEGIEVFPALAFGLQMFGSFNRTRHWCSTFVAPDEDCASGETSGNDLCGLHLLGNVWGEAPKHGDVWPNDEIFAFVFRFDLVDFFVENVGEKDDPSVRVDSNEGDKLADENGGLGELLD